LRLGPGARTPVLEGWRVAPDLWDFGPTSERLEPDDWPLAPKPRRLASELKSPGHNPGLPALDLRRLASDPCRAGPDS
jgi:hypothetical protein